MLYLWVKNVFIYLSNNLISTSRLWAHRDEPCGWWVACHKLSGADQWQWRIKGVRQQSRLFCGEGGVREDILWGLIGYGILFID